MGVGFPEEATSPAGQASQSQQSHALERQKQRRREAYRIENGSAALEGYTPTPEDLAQQERVINGSLTFAQSVALHIAKAKAKGKAHRAA